jgi:hypothetical protein
MYQFEGASAFEQEIIMTLSDTCSPMEQYKILHISILHYQSNSFQLLTARDANLAQYSYKK